MVDILSKASFKRTPDFLLSPSIPFLPQPIHREFLVNSLVEMSVTTKRYLKSLDSLNLGLSSDLVEARVLVLWNAPTQNPSERMAAELSNQQQDLWQRFAILRGDLRNYTHRGREISLKTEHQRINGLNQRQISTLVVDYFGDDYIWLPLIQR